MLFKPTSKPWDSEDKLGMVIDAYQLTPSGVEAGDQSFGITFSYMQSSQFVLYETL